MQNRRTETVVITGASAGVGRATARAFARHGAAVGLIARGQEALEATRAEVEALGGRALVIPADVADQKQMERAAERVEQELGPIDIWINNAMATVFAPVMDTQPDEFKRATEVTYFGAVWGTMAALRRMRERGRGTIIQVSSALAFRGIPLQAAYCGAKHALLGFTTSLRSELLHDRSAIHLGMVHLSAMNTPQFDWNRAHLSHQPQPVPPVFQPEVAADAIYWAAHHRRRDLYVGMPSLKAIWANRVVPGLLDIYLARVGYHAQQGEDAVDPARQDNLWAPVPGDRGARGRFDEQASGRSTQLWVSKNRGWLAAAGLVGCAVLGNAVRRRQSGKGK